MRETALVVLQICNPTLRRQWGNRLAHAPRMFRPAHVLSPAEHKRLYDERRGSSTERGYGAAWRRARLGHLAAHPLCVECECGGMIVAASVVDHVTPHRGDMALFWDPNNWQSLCKPCHDSWKQSQESGSRG